MSSIASQVRTDVGPPIHSFPVSELEERVQTNEKGKKRKVPVKLEDCKLMQMVQYDCKVNKKTREVECRPLLKLFRQ
jgi:uncharacterized membrane protein